MKPIKLHNDGYNEIVFKSSTNKVVIGINIGSWHGARYISFPCYNQEDAMSKGKEYINKKSKVKIK